MIPLPLPISNIDAANLRRVIRRGERSVYAVAEEAVRQLKKARVPILAGSDVPNPGTRRGDIKATRSIVSIWKMGVAMGRQATSFQSGR